MAIERDTARPEVGTMPAERAQEWATHRRTAAAASTYVYDFVGDVTADAEDPFCTDVGDNVLLDFTSRVAAAPLGYNNPLLMDLAYVIVEPIQGEGGYRISSDPFMEELSAVCAEHDVLLIADEIQTGLGRTGEMRASDHFAIEPD